MFFCIADRRANPQEPDEIRRVLDDAGFRTYITSNGNVCLDILTHTELFALSRELDAVVEAEISVDGCDVGTQIRLKDREGRDDRFQTNRKIDPECSNIPEEPYINRTTKPFIECLIKNRSTMPKPLESPAHTYTDDARVRAVVDCIREMTDTGECCAFSEIQERMKGQMAWKTTWKALQAVQAEGMAERVSVVGATGHTKNVFVLDWWYELSDEQRERMVAALEDIAASLRMQTGRKAQRETKAVRADEGKESE